jgi:hypothetical protein
VGSLNQKHKGSIEINANAYSMKTKDGRKPLQGGIFLWNKFSYRMNFLGMNFPWTNVPRLRTNIAEIYSTRPTDKIKQKV